MTRRDFVFSFFVNDFSFGLTEIELKDQKSSICVVSTMRPVHKHPLCVIWELQLVPFVSHLYKEVTARRTPEIDYSFSRRTHLRNNLISSCFLAWHHTGHVQQTKTLCTEHSTVLSPLLKYNQGNTQNPCDYLFKDTAPTSCFSHPSETFLHNVIRAYGAELGRTERHLFTLCKRALKF